MVSTSGAQLLPERAVKVLCDDLLPVTTILTPNIPEANLLLRKAGRAPFSEIKDLEGLKHLAAEVQALGPKFVLLKGGHLPLTSSYQTARTEEEKKLVCNILFTGDSADVLEFPYQKSPNTHGTGCSLASALACNLAHGLDLTQAVVAACRYVEAGIKTSFKLGQGSGPINHFHSLQIMPFAPGGFVDYLLDRFDVQPAWHAFTHHEFVNNLGNGTLEPEKFKYYMIQDYLYLIQFARANALAGYKSKSLADVAAAASIVQHIKRETDLHVRECEAFGLSEAAMQKVEEHQACTAYTRYVLDIGQSEDWLALQISLLPCLLGYGVIAKRLKAEQKARRGSVRSVLEGEEGGRNAYQTWIENYVAEDYTEAVRKGCGEFFAFFSFFLPFSIGWREGILGNVANVSM